MGQKLQIVVILSIKNKELQKQQKRNLLLFLVIILQKVRIVSTTELNDHPRHFTQNYTILH